MEEKGDGRRNREDEKGVELSGACARTLSKSAYPSQKRRAVDREDAIKFGV